MKKNILLAALLSLCLVSCGEKNETNNSSNTNSNNIQDSTNSSNNNKPSDKPSNPGEIDITANDFNGYYKDVIDLEGRELIYGLHELINEGRFTSYDELKSAYYKTDSIKNPAGQTKFVDFYTHNYLNTEIDWSKNWNREHVWPKSLGVNGTNAYGDLHHIRPSEPHLNSFRGNCKFGNLNGGTVKDGCKKSGNTFEPNDISKGDSARIVVYVAVAHNLNIRNVMTGNDDTIKKTLLEWNKLDPVDEIEIKRNNEAQKIQHNRNVFIDSNYLFEEVVNTLL